MSTVASLLPYPPHADPKAWDIIHNFATSEDRSLPEAETALQAHLGDRFVDSDWQQALAAVMEAEGDTKQALGAINDLYKSATRQSGFKFWIPAPPTVAPKTHQAELVEGELMKDISDLKARNRIFGPIPSVDDILNPLEERQQEGAPLDGSVKGIADMVWKKVAGVDRDVEEVEDSDSKDDARSPIPSCADLIALCQRVEQGCMQYGDPQFSLELSLQLSKFCGILQREELLFATQTTLDRFFS